MTSPIVNEPGTLLKALLAHARRRGVRQVEATAGGTVVLDGVGRRLPVRLGGREVVEAHREIPVFLRLGDGPGDAWFRREHEDQGELGEWGYKIKGDAFVMRPRKPSPPCVDALFKAAPEGMERIRALYGLPGVGIVVACVGAPRARDLAQAIVAELASFGAAPTFEQRVAITGHHGHHATDEHLGLEFFDQVARAGVAPADVVMAGKWPAGIMAPPGDSTRVTVVGTDRHGWRAPTPRSFEAATTPVALVQVSLSPVDSSPCMAVTLSPAARELAGRPLPVPDGMPWETYGKARDTRRPRVSAPRTWHQTTAQVARAFVGREAPRGLVSGHALFFHGPVAFSLHDENPIAAYVTDGRGGTVVLVGRDDVGGVSSKAVVSMAMADVSDALGKGTPIIDVGAGLDDILRWDGIKPSQGAWRFGRAKDEHARPRACTVDPESLGKQFDRRMKALVAEREVKSRSSFPTLGHARAISDVARLVLLRDAIADRLGLDIPTLGDATVLQTEADEAYRANAAHVEGRARLKAERDAARASRSAATEAPHPNAP